MAAVGETRSRRRAYYDTLRSLPPITRDGIQIRLLLNAGADPDRTDAAAGYSARDYATRDTRARDILKLINDKKPKGA